MACCWYSLTASDSLNSLKYANLNLWQIWSPGCFYSPQVIVGGIAAGIWAYQKHRQRTNVHIMALNLVRGVPLTPREKETMLDILTPPPPPRKWWWPGKWCSALIRSIKSWFLFLPLWQHRNDKFLLGAWMHICDLWSWIPVQHNICNVYSVLHGSSWVCCAIEAMHF
jgi:hypothetical protein